MGAAVERTYPDTIEIEGRKRLRGAEHRVVPDRIEAGTFVVAAAVTGRPRDARGRAVRPPRRRSSRRSSRVGVGARRAAPTRSRSTAPPSTPAATAPCDIETAPYPGLATDLQPPTSVLLTQATGMSHVHETIFEDRLEWLAEVRRMGADVDDARRPPRDHRRPGPPRRGEVEIGDLRAGASLILAALAAEGTTTIHGAHHVHRGYENIERKFLDLGASIARSAEGTAVTTS